MHKYVKRILSMVLALVLILSVFPLSTLAAEPEEITVSEKENVVSIENANVALRYNLEKGSYDAVDKRYGTTVVKDAVSSYNGETSFDNGYIFSYTTEKVDDSVGKGTMLSIKAEKEGAFTQYLCFTLYEGENFILISPGIENTTNEVIQLKEIHPIDTAKAFEGEKLENLSMLDGNSGHWENVDNNSWSRTATYVRHNGAVRCRNNMLITYGTEYNTRSLVFGGITYHEFSKYMQTGFKPDDNTGLADLSFEATRNISMYASDPVGKRVDPGTVYMPNDKFYIDFSIDDPFEILEKYAFVLKDAQEIDISLYNYPTICLWNAGAFGGFPGANNATGGVKVMDEVVKSGFLKYTPVGIRLEPDQYGEYTEQGWWDDEHFKKYGHLTDEYPTMKDFCTAITERGGIPHIYSQTSAMSRDLAELKPEWQLYNKNGYCYTRPDDYDGEQYDPEGGRLWNRLGGANSTKVGWDFTDPEFEQHMKEVYSNLNDAGLRGIKFDYVDTAWETGGFEDPYSTTAGAYRRPFELAKEGLGKDSFIDERTLYCGSDLALGAVDSHRIQSDTAAINKEMAELGILRWYKDRVVINYDLDSKNLNAFSNRDGVRKLISVTYAVSSRFVLANVFTQLTDEQIYDLSRAFPMHDFEKSYRPVDAFINRYPHIYAMEIEPGWQSLMFYNTNDSQAATMSTKLCGDMAFGGLELDPEKFYYIYDFWNDSYVGRFKGSETFTDTVRPGEARIYAVKEDKGVPQLLSTNRHLLQGAIDTENITWNDEESQLTGTLKVVKEDPYTAVIRVPYGKQLKSCEVSTGLAETKMVGNNLELTVNTTENEDVNFILTFEDKEIIPAKGMQFDVHEMELKESKTAQIHTVFDPLESTIQDCVWKTSNPEVATVSNRGIVTAVAEGNATITATSVDGNFTDSCEVKVLPLYEFPYMDDFENGMDGWIASSGNWKLVKEGDNTVMSSTMNGNSALYYGNPNWTDYAFEADIRMDGDSATMGLLIRADSADLRKAYITDFEDGQLRVFNRNGNERKTVPGKTWEKGRWYRMRIEAEGNTIRGYRDGELIAEIQATSQPTGKAGLFTWNGAASFDNVAIVPLGYHPPQELEKLEFDRTDVDMLKGYSLELIAKQLPAGANEEIYFSSSDETVATVDENGYVHAVGKGEAVITVSNADGTITDTCAVTVVDEEDLSFKDDFESGSLDRWTTLEGEFAVKEEDGNHVIHTTKLIDNGKRADIFAGNAGWENYVYEADVRLDSGSTVGILTRADSANLQRSYILDFENGKMRVFSRYNSARVEVPGFQMDYGKWYHFRIEVEGDTIRGYRDGQFIAEIKDPGLPKGKIGLFCYNGSASYDNIKVYGIPKADKSDLGDLIEYAQTQQKTEDYTYLVPVVKEAFEKALAEAINVNNREDAICEEVEAAYDKLLKMVHMLDFTGNNISLSKMVQQVKDLEAKNYTAATWEVFADARTKAQGVLDNPNSLQAEIDEARVALRSAIFQLRLIPDKGQLEGLIKNAQAVNTANYTVKSATAFTAALDNAKAVFADENATEEDVKSAEKALEEAQKNLVAKADVKEDADKVASDDGSKKPDTKSAAKTGDGANAAIPAAAGLAAVLAALVAWKKKSN